MINKILIIAPTPFFSHRGCHIRIYEMTRILKGKYKPIILTYPVGENIQGFNIIRTPKIFRNIRDLKIGPSFIRLMYDFLMLIEGIKILRKQEIQFILSFLHEGIIIGKILSFIFQKKLIADIQGSFAGEISEHTRIKEGSFLFYWIKFLEQFLLLLPDGIIFNTRYLASKIKRKRAVYIVPDFPPSQIKIPRGSEKGIIYIGVLTKYQGIEYLLKMMEYFKKDKKEFKLYIIGYPDIDKYRKQAQKMGIAKNVEFLGKVSYFEVGNYIKDGMVAISPKISQFEGNGKLLLYLAYHLPIVVFDTPVNREILEDAGIYVPLKNVRLMAEKINLLLKNKALYKKYQTLSQKKYRELVKARLTYLKTE